MHLAQPPPDPAVDEAYSAHLACCRRIGEYPLRKAPFTALRLANPNTWLPVRVRSDNGFLMVDVGSGSTRFTRL